MKLTIEKTFGPYLVTAAANVALPVDATEENKALCREGLLHIFERQPSSAVEQKVCALEEGWEKNKRGNGYVRPKDFKRTEFAFTADRAEKIKAAYNSTPGKLDETREIVFEVVSIVEYEGGEKATQRKMAKAMVDGLSEAEQKSMRMMCGVAPDCEYDDLVEAVHAKWFAKKTSK